ncbi:DUF3598 family protein [Kovacikia minuta CCNUW1]|uniref:DUF3598 family protein n=1 Tax=Kovacikia minuta TaxID=2931930 RepID=UPI001CCB80D4|nr:DUF3598 family protein [Kovacikia minuta]UBF27528.1 DUF3598 family protein [Kovacikia minuta CCNUW1]
MKSQWESFLQNLGEWRGTFARFSPQAEFLGDTPTVVSFEGLNTNQTVRQVVRRYATDVSVRSDESLEGIAPTEERVLEYSSLGGGLLFFEDGAFSQGSIQLAPFSEFGAELGFIETVGDVPGNRRLRLVQLYNNRRLEQITLIREQRAGTPVVENPPLQLADLIGEWRGEAVTLYPDWRHPDTFPTHLKLSLDNDRLLQQLSYGEGGSDRTLTSSATIHESVLKFDQGTHLVQVVMLPNGASSTCPVEIQLRQPFFLEAGWLIQPTLRQRMIRSYNSKGEWVSLTLVTEQKVS